MPRFSLFLTIVVASLLFSCKKNCHSVISLQETHWDLYFKNNSSFNFYATSDLYFKADKTAENYRNFDTVLGNWSQDNSAVSISFNTGDQYTGTIITNDSISGTLTASGNDGVWYAKKR